MERKLLESLPALCGSAGSSEFVCKLLCCSKSLAARIEAVAAKAVIITYKAENTQSLQQLAKWLQNARNRAVVRVVDLQLQWLNSRNSKTLVDIIHLLAQPDSGNKLRTLAVVEPLDGYGVAAVSYCAAALLSPAHSDQKAAIHQNSPHQLATGRLPPTMSSGESAFGTANVDAQVAAVAGPSATPVVTLDNLPADVISCKFGWAGGVCSLLQQYGRVFADVHLEYKLGNSWQLPSDHLCNCCTLLASKLRSVEVHFSEYDSDDRDKVVSALQQVADVAAAAATADPTYQLQFSYCGWFPGLVEIAAEMPNSIVLESLTLDVSRSWAMAEDLAQSQLTVLTNLKNLLIKDDWNHSMQYLTAVSRLTQLQSLGLDLGSNRAKARAMLQQISTLSNLQSLKLECASTKTDWSKMGVWLDPAFGQLTALTKLDMKTDSGPEPRYLLPGSGIPKSIEWLEIDGFMDLSDVTCLSCLKTLVLGRGFLASGVGGREYQRLRCLSKLNTIRASIGRVEAVPELHDFACVWAELPIIQLRMEVDVAHGFDRLPLQHFSSLLQIQDLSICVYDVAWRSVSRVVPLDLDALAACLQHCTGLRKLGLGPPSGMNWGEPKVEGVVTFVNVLSNLRALQELRLPLPDVGDAMIGLCNASQLTSLKCKVSSRVAECIWNSLPNLRMLDNLREPVVRRT